MDAILHRRKNLKIIIKGETTAPFSEVCAFIERIKTKRGCTWFQEEMGEIAHKYPDVQVTVVGSPNIYLAQKLHFWGRNLISDQHLPLQVEVLVDTPDPELLGMIRTHLGCEPVLQTEESVAA